MQKVRILLYNYKIDCTFCWILEANFSEETKAIIFCICNHQNLKPQICIRKSVIRSQFSLLHFWKFDVFSIVTTDFCFVSSEEAGKIFDKIEGLSGKIRSKKLQHYQAKPATMGSNQVFNYLILKLCITSIKSFYKYLNS